MDWSRMRSLVAERLGLELSTATGDGNVDPDLVAYELQEAYRFTIPNRVHGACRKGFFDAEVTVAGGRSYLLDSLANGPTVRGLLEPVTYGSQQLDYYSDPATFLADWPGYDTTAGTPQAVLVEGRSLMVAPTPAATYTLRFRAAFYRDEIQTGTGVVDDAEAKACVFAAAASIAAQDGDDELAARMGTLFEAKIEELFSKYGANDLRPPPLQNGGF